MKRRGFILFEVFVAIALISLAVIPISSYPAKIYKKEMDLLKHLDREPLYDVAMADFIKTLDTENILEERAAKIYPSLLGEHTSRIDVEIKKEAGSHRLLKCTLWIDDLPKKYFLHIHIAK